MAVVLPESREVTGPDVTGWLLEDACIVLTDYEMQLIETAPPRAAGPLGDWRVLRCRYAPDSEDSKAHCELLVAREQLPKADPVDSHS